MLNKDAVKPELIETLSWLQASPELASFRLVDGTAIALHIGHRKSADIDLYSTEPANMHAIAQLLSSKFHNGNLAITDEMIAAQGNGIKVEVWHNWMMPFKQPAIISEGIRLAALEDLAAFKLSAVVGRREKKDYVDLCFLFDKLGTRKVLEDFKGYNPWMSLKSLAFALSEARTAQENISIMPDMIVPFDWQAGFAKILSAFKMFREIEEINDGAGSSTTTTDHKNLS